MANEFDEFFNDPAPAGICPVGVCNGHGVIHVVCEECRRDNPYHEHTASNYATCDVCA